MSEKVTIAWGLRRILRDKVGDWCRPRVVFTTLTAVALVAPHALADEPMQRVTLEQALEMFEENSLELRLVAADRDRALGFARQARAHPNPVVAFSHEGLSESGRDYSESYVTLSQRLEWPGRRGARAETSDEEAAVLQSRLDAERRRLAFEVKRVFIEAAAAEERVGIVRDVRAVFRMAEESGQERFREGDLSGYDVRRLRIERARYENLGASAEIDLNSARLRLASLILPDAPGIAPTAAPEGAPPSEGELEEKKAIVVALERRAEMRSAEAQLAAANASIRYLTTFTGPDVTVTGGYKRQSDGFNGFFVGVNVPLPTFDRRKGDLEAAEADARGALARVDLTRRSIENDVRRALVAYASLSGRVSLIRNQLLSEVDDLLRIARVSYSEGEMSLLELLDAAEAFRESQILRSRLSSEHWISYYDLERAMGGVPVAATTGGTER
ncbi:MAG: TolC family protein [Acidobacteria bacterium]|nr:MAG: TolC family protein [Acidobacteriota bacterium]